MCVEIVNYGLCSTSSSGFVKSQTLCPIRVKVLRGFTPQLNISSKVKCFSTHSVEPLSLHFVLVEMTGEAELCQDSYRSLSAMTACHCPTPPIASTAPWQTWRVCQGAWMWPNTFWHATVRCVLWPIKEPVEVILISERAFIAKLQTESAISWI